MVQYATPKGLPEDRLTPSNKAVQCLQGPLLCRRDREACASLKCTAKLAFYSFLLKERGFYTNIEAESELTEI